MSHAAWVAANLSGATVFNNDLDRGSRQGRMDWCRGLYGEKSMHVTIVHVRVKQEHVRDFIEASRRNHMGSVQEQGNRRFDVLQSAEDPTRFVLYEAYDSAEDAAAHKETEHYLKWRETVADWMAEPREGVPYNGLFPEI